MPRVPLQLAAIVIIAFALYFVWDFSQRVVTSVRLMQYEQQIDRQVQQAQATQTALLEKKKQVQSDAYVESVVRGWRWAKDGETVAITQITPAPTPAPAPPPAAPTPDIPWWRQLLNFLFGT
jgi:hypothetical protein